MSEVRAIYQLSPPASLSAFRARKCVLAGHDVNYIPPTSVDVSALISLAGWPRSTLSKILGGESQIPDVTNPDINYPAWRLLLIHAGVISCQEELSISKEQ